ncbi:hypothetical protein [Dapis sp. BLCC M229]|uniref:hypothetical protein n=1 Tax=Dapis sp. BLCC M229 TaxID=3400188 RepID=UPI003CF35D25
MISINDVFNENFYLEINPDAAASVIQGNFASGLDHFLNVGINQGLQFSPFIDLDYYKRVANPDLVDFTNQEALDHLLEIGIEEGRLFSPFVDLEFYKQANPDLANLSNSEALLHLQNFGLEEGRQFAESVNLEEYRSFNPELATQNLTNAFINLATQFAPDDEGRIRFPLEAANVSFTDELDIVTPEMLEGGVDVTLTYSKSANTVVLEADFTGLPYRVDIVRDDDPSTPYNQYPVSIEDSRWQLWMLTSINTVESNFWYDGQTGNLIGNEFDIFEIIPETNTGIDVNNDGIEDIALSLPVTHQLSTPVFEGNPDGTGSFTFEFAYDQLLDEQGKGGTFFTEVPYNINRPEEFGPYYTQGGLPISEAPTFDDVLETMRSPFGFSIGHSAEPEVKPDYLLSRASLMIGFTNFYPDQIPDNVIFEPIEGIYRFTEPTDLVSNTNEPAPARAAAIEAEKEDIFGDSGDNIFDAADPSDNFDGNQDSVFAGTGDDLIDASQATAPSFPSTLGNNRLYGNRGDDTFFAGEGDSLLGGKGDDTFMILEGGNNIMTGGLGSDIFWISTSGLPNSSNTITDFEAGIDQIAVGGIGVSSVNDLDISQRGEDTVISFSGIELSVLNNIQVSDLSEGSLFFG